MGEIVNQRTANLIEKRGATAALLADPLSWRVRVVEELVVDSATSCIRRRSLQAAPLRPLLGGLVSRRHTHALIALNVAPMPRGPLLDFNVHGPLGDAWLLPRGEIATRQRVYLLRLASTCGECPPSRVAKLMTAILSFTGEWFINGVPRDLTGYFRDGLGRQTPSSTVRDWLAIGEQCKTILRPRLDQFHGYSAPENPALVLPGLFLDEVIATDDEATELLREYLSLLQRIDAFAQHAGRLSAGEEFLVALADYANSFDLIAAMRVPLDEPFLVKFSERRDLRLSRLRNSGQQHLVVADARTNHVTFKVSDPNVRIVSFEALEPGSDRFAYGAFQSRTDQQSRAFYAHDPDRDYRLRLTFRMALLRRLQAVPYIVAALLAALTAALWISLPTQLESLALIVGPSAIAASVLLYREPSTLGSRLRHVSSVILALTLVALLATATLLYVLGPNVLGVG